LEGFDKITLDAPKINSEGHAKYLLSVRENAGGAKEFSPECSAAELREESANGSKTPERGDGNRLLGEYCN
jgi:hypothetical protein